MSRINFLGALVDSLTMEEALAHLERFIASRSPHLVVALNVPKLWRMQRDCHLKSVVEKANLILPEPVIVLASRLCGKPLRSYIGNDRLTEAFLPIAAKHGYRLYFLGTSVGTLERLVKRIRNRESGINIVGFHDGFFTEDEAADVARHIRDARPDIVFAGMGTPRQEYWMAQYAPQLGVPVVVGVGGTLDVLAGLKRECPDWIRTIGTEWIYRLIEDPRGKLKRYLVALPWFAWALLVREFLPRWFPTRNAAEN